jgi:hypothetical protein
MKSKCYSVILVLSKWSKSQEVFVQAYYANNKDHALSMAIKSGFVTKLLLDGYAINSKNVGALHESVAPINSESDCLVNYQSDKSPALLYIDLRAEYEDEFKQDLQDFMSKHFVNIPAIYPKETA